MPRVFIDNIPVLSYDFTARQKYWTALSQYLITKHGKQHFTEHAKVEEILLDGFQFLVDEFRKLLQPENSLKFYLYIFWLHEESIKLYVKTLDGFKLEEIDENEFAMYRRILKLILEQGCNTDLEWGKFPNAEELKMMDDKIQELLYLGTWIYGFADFIAFHKMVEECHDIKFDEKDLLMVDWQYHYGETYNQLFPMLREDYVKGTFDKGSIHELKAAIESCFGVDYNFAIGIIFEIKKHHSPNDPTLQTIQPHVLPLNLVQQRDITQNLAETFYAGLTLSRQNKLSIEEVVRKPYSTQRYMFRPILVYNVSGEERALVGIEKFAESIMVLATNAIHWNAMQKEWLTVKCIQTFVNKKGNEHDKIFEDKIEEIIKSKDFFYCRNIKTFKQPSGSNLRIDNALAGEIDFIIVNQELQRIFVADAKYNRARYEGVGFRNDYSNFLDSYEPQLKKKVDWIANNLTVLQEHLKIINNLAVLDLTSYEVEGIFLINTPTFYMFNGTYKAITLKQTSEFIDGKYEYPHLMISNEDGEDEYVMMVQHPYFRKPLIFTDYDET